MQVIFCINFLFQTHIFFILFFIRQEREQTAALRLQQDEAYLESLRADQEKARKRQLEEEAQMKLVDEERQLEELQNEQKERLKRLKVEYSEKIPQVNIIFYIIILKNSCIIFFNLLI